MGFTGWYFGWLWRCLWLFPSSGWSSAIKSVCVGCECCLAEWLNGWAEGHSRLTWKMIARAVQRSWDKNPEKCFSKWGASRLIMPLNKKLPLSVWSTGSPALHILLMVRRCELSPLNTRADTCLNSPGEWGHMCRCVCVGACFQEPVLYLLSEGIFVKSRVIFKRS